MGRKTLDTPKVRISVRLDGEVFPELEQIAKNEGRTVANLLAQLGADAVKRKKRQSKGS